MKVSRSMMISVAVAAALAEIAALGLLAAMLGGGGTEGGTIASLRAGFGAALAVSPLLTVTLLLATLLLLLLVLFAGSGGSQKPEQPATAAAGSLPPYAAIELLGLLQSEGRLVDFLQEDLTPYGDAQVAAAARAIHAGCRRVLSERLKLVPVLEGEEGAEVTVEAGFDPGSIRVTGKVTGEPPYKGVLRHPGWRSVSIDLPQRAAARDSTLVAPAEVEVV